MLVRDGEMVEEIVTDPQPAAHKARNAHRPGMAVTGINSEDRLVQATFAEHLQDGARLGERLRLERRDLRARRHAGPRRHAEVVLTRDLRAALVAPESRAAAAAIDEAFAALTRARFQPLAGAAQSGFLPLASATACR